MKVEIIPPIPEEPTVVLSMTKTQAKLLKSIHGHGGKQRWDIFVQGTILDSYSCNDLSSEIFRVLGNIY